MGLEKDVFSLVEDEVASDLDVIEDRSRTVEDHIPGIVNSHIGSSLGKSIIWPIGYIGPKSRKVFSVNTNNIFRTGVEAANSIDVDPLTDGLVASTHTHEEVRVVGIMIVVSIYTGRWVSQAARSGYVRQLERLLIPLSDVVELTIVRIVESQDY